MPDEKSVLETVKNHLALNESKQVNKLIGVQIDSTSARVSSPTDPNVNVVVRVLHPSMLLVD
jgi:hypothetical protein